MLEAVFVIQLDDYHGFIVEKRYPSSLSLNEKILNLVYYDHLKEKDTTLKISDIEGMLIVSFMGKQHPGWMVCFVIDETESLETLHEEISGMSRLILELITSNPEAVDLAEILKNRSILSEPTEEQKLAEVFLTPSTALILERMQSQGVDSAAKLSIWLKNEIQSDNIDIREAVGPLLRSGIVKVEIIGKTRETVFLMKDIFCYRAPPVESIEAAQVAFPKLMERYTHSVRTFFSPPPPDKGYNPTLPVDDPNSPIMEDREQIAKVLAHSLHYIVLSSLRKGPLSVEQISEKSSLPKDVVQNSLWALEADRVAMYFDIENVWALLTNPMIESFLPEYTLHLVEAKYVDKELSKEAAIRYLELLENAWGENK
jgi:hypothetical protein